jgi:hypothetical protein
VARNENLAKNERHKRGPGDILRLDNPNPKVETCDHASSFQLPISNFIFGERMDKGGVGERVRRQIRVPISGMNIDISQRIRHSHPILILREAREP